MREKLDQYNFKPIREMTKSMMGEWLTEELKFLYRDFSQNVDLDQITHEAWRLSEELKSKYRSWLVGDVHAAFQTTLDGSFRKVSIMALFSVLRKRLKEKQNADRVNENKSTYEDVDHVQAAKDAAYYGPYIRWWMDYNVDPKQVDVHMYNEAKNNGELVEFTKIWRDSKKNETEGMTFVRNINNPQKLREVV